MYKQVDPVKHCGGFFKKINYNFEQFSKNILKSTSLKSSPHLVTGKSSEATASLTETYAAVDVVNKLVKALTHLMGDFGFDAFGNAIKKQGRNSIHLKKIKKIHEVNYHKSPT